MILTLLVTAFLTTSGPTCCPASLPAPPVGTRPWPSADVVIAQSPVPGPVAGPVAGSVKGAMAAPLAIEDEPRADEADNQPATQPAPEVKEAASDVPEDAVKLLDEIERAGKDLRTFTADILYQVEDDLLGDKVIRAGEIIYDMGDAGDERSIAVLFNERIVNRRRREQLKHYIFTGRWLVEIDHDDKLFYKREIVAPGETFDPLKLGEGPFPLPVGQSRADVVERFFVGSIHLPGVGALARLRGMYDDLDGLRLRPRPGTPMAEDIKHIDLFYDRATRLPVGVDLVEVTGKRKTARLKDLRRNPTLDEATRAKLSVKEPDPKAWKVEIEPWKGG